MPIKVLMVNGGLMDLGGISTFMMNFFRHIDPDVVHIDFIVHGEGKGVHDEEIASSGSIIYHVPIKSKRYIANTNELKRIFKSGKYDIVHSNLDAGNYHILKIAKKCGIKVRISHSHNTNFLTYNRIKLIINKWYVNHMNNVATHALACSDDAGKWLFGNKMDYTVIHNAINLNNFFYNQDVRDEIRSQYNFSNSDIVLGHVGRFDNQKNQSFLIKVLDELVSKDANYKLMLIGDGWQREEVQRLTDQYQISSNVIFVGAVQNVNQFYNAFDIFLLPSIFEGLGIVGIEAQANGLPCVFSEFVPKETILFKNVSSLKLDINLWCEQIMQISKIRNSDFDLTKLSAYNIRDESHKLEEIYKRMVNYD